MQPLLSRSDFDKALAAGDAIVITDSAHGPKVHRPPCRWVTATNFGTKVVQGHGKYGAYFSFPTLEAALGFRGVVPCSYCANGVKTVVALPKQQTPASREIRALLSAPAEPTENFHVTASVPRLVEGWSTQCLNFEPKDWRKVFRQALRTAILQLHAQKDEGLCARYIARERGPSDVENVLFYNVDSAGGSFAACAGSAIRFERVIGTPPSTPDGVMFSHYARYEVEPLLSPARTWSQGTVLARWDRQACGHPQLWKRAARVWKWMKEAELALLGSPTRGGPDFGLRIVLHGPTGSLNLVRFIKPLFDGVIAAFQADDGKSSNDGIAIHAQKAGIAVEDAAARLCDSSRAVLGNTTLLDRRGQMRPSDETCLTGELVRDSEPSNEWACSGEIFLVAART